MLSVISVTTELFYLHWQIAYQPFGVYLIYTEDDNAQSFEEFFMKQNHQDE